MASKLFQSNFGPSVVLGSATNGFRTLSGTDSSSGFNWTQGAAFNCHQPRIQQLDDGLGQGIYDNGIETLVGPTGIPTTALRMRMTAENTSSGGYAQDAFVFEPGIPITEIYYEFDLKLSALSSILKTDGINNWMVVSEWKTGGLWNTTAPYGGDLRNQLAIQRNNDGTFIWVWHLDTNANDPSVPFKTLVTTVSSLVPIKDNTWYKVQAYVKRSTGADGLISWKVNGVELVHHTGPNYGQNLANINRIFLAMVYFGGIAPSAVWITNLQIWNGLPSIAVTGPTAPAKLTYHYHRRSTDP